MRIHLGAALAVTLAGMWVRLRAWEWAAVVACICFVLVCELLNTAIEKTCDLVTKERREDIKYIKDIAAGAVLLACVMAVVVGCIVFVPHLLLYIL